MKHQWQRWIEPWYLAYALLGATTSGMAPILLPLIVSRTGGANHIGLVMAIFYLGGLMSPLWGGLADRHSLHRWVLSGGLLVAAVGLALFPFTTNRAASLGLALMQGAGAAGAATVANLFVVEAHPQGEWDKRIGWLQTFYGGGQVAGLLMAGALSRVSLRAGLLVAAGLTFLAVMLGWLTTTTPSNSRACRPVLLFPGRHSEGGVGAPQRHYHFLTLNAIRQLGRVWSSPFGLFIVIWLVSYAGSSAFFSFYPVLMQQLYGVDPSLSSTGFAVAAAIGLALYSPAGRWSERFRPGRVLRAALTVRLLAFFGLFFLGMFHFLPGWLALPGFLFIVLAWSVLSVSGTALTAQISPVGEGEGMGIFNAATALAGVVGAVLGGWVSGYWGYSGAVALAAAGVGIGVVLSFVRSVRRDKPYPILPEAPRAYGECANKREES